MNVGRVVHLTLYYIVSHPQRAKQLLQIDPTNLPTNARYFRYSLYSVCSLKGYQPLLVDNPQCECLVVDPTI